MSEASKAIDGARVSSELLAGAVHRNSAFSRKGLSERTFTLAFSQLVYPQIWEDPEVDMEALAIEPQHRIVTIASGGCNVMSYLTANPVHITAVDLNSAHIALNKLKIAAATHLPGYDTFHRFFANAAARENIAAYHAWIAPHLDSQTRAYWEGRDLRGRRRINRFARGFYRHGLLGNFIAAGHLIARAFGKNPKRMMTAKSREEQIAIYEADLAPLLQRPTIRRILDQRSSLFGLGIPPAQYDALAGGRPMHEVIEERLRRLATGFDLKDNYFAWQAFNRGYANGETGPLPPYLQKANFAAVRNNASRVAIVHTPMTAYLAQQPSESLDRYVLLDAQDWMGTTDLTALWREITRTARPGARVIFRTAGCETILPGRIPESILSAWRYEHEASLDWTARDRSAIYGGFHLYVKGA